jgi:hypothetical protein
MANEVVINVKANTDKARSGLRGIGESLTRVSRTAGIAASAVGALGAVAIKSFVGAAMEQERAMKTLASGIELTGVSFDSVKDKILATTAALQNKTNFGDEQQMKALALMVPILGDVDKAMLALPAVMDAASASGKSLETVSGTLTRALSGQVNQAVSIGMAFDKDATFGERLAQVLGSVGGAAEANVDPFQQLSNDLGDLKETIGAALIPILMPLVTKFREVFKTMQEMNPQFIKMVAIALAAVTAFGLIGGPILLLVSMLPALIGGVTMLGGAFALLLGPIGLVAAVIVAFGIAWQRNMFGIRDITAVVWSSIRNFIAKSINSVVAKINFLIDGLNLVAGLFDKTIPPIEEMAESIMELGKNVKDTVVEFVGLKNITDEVVENRDRFGAQPWNLASPKGGDIPIDAGGQEGAAPTAARGPAGAIAGVAPDQSRFVAGWNFLMTQSALITGGMGGVSGEGTAAAFRRINDMNNFFDDAEVDEWALFQETDGGL